jgi:hypothetical protein
MGPRWTEATVSSSTGQDRTRLSRSTLTDRYEGTSVRGLGTPLARPVPRAFRSTSGSAFRAHPARCPAAHTRPGQAGFAVPSPRVVARASDRTPPPSCRTRLARADVPRAGIPPPKAGTLRRGSGWRTEIRCCVTPGLSVPDGYGGGHDHPLPASGRARG